MNQTDDLLLEQQLCFALYSASRSMTKAYQPFLKDLGLTYPQYLVLMVLWQSDDCAVKTLGEKLYLDSGTLTPLLKRLENMQMLQRQRSSEDERMLIVSLTKQGRELQQVAATKRSQFMCDKGVDATKLTALREQLHALTISLRE